MCWNDASIAFCKCFVNGIICQSQSEEQPEVWFEPVLLLLLKHQTTCGLENIFLCSPGLYTFFQDRKLCSRFWVWPFHIWMPPFPILFVNDIKSDSFLPILRPIKVWSLANHLFHFLIQSPCVYPEVTRAHSSPSPHTGEAAGHLCRTPPELLSGTTYLPNPPPPKPC